jgi:cardiolipin synthase A/B
LYAWLLLSVTLPTSLFVVGFIAFAFLLAFLLSGIFGPTPRYAITNREQLPPNNTPEFLNLLESLADARVNHTGQVEILKNGPAFYPAELDAIRGAHRSINLEAYIFQKSEIGAQYVDAMTERARAGVQVNVVLDAFGSASATRSFFEPLLAAGGKVAWYNSPAWHNLTRLGHRTHRELLIVDGRIGFIGGAGVADQWYCGVKDHPHWRDTMVRVEGEAVPNLQATFAENWLASCGELLAGDAYFPDIECPHRTELMVINSTPTAGGSTRARVLFQLLIASAQHSISITTPYFLPDKSLIEELCRAVVDRHIKMRILVPGQKSDHLLTRSTSRGGYGPLLKAGAEVWEYQPSMIHAKVLVVDSLWAVVGSTNFDNRSFGINDEVNLAMCDAAIAGRLEADMSDDLLQSCRVSLEAWKHRPIFERAPELLGWIFERQQ